MNIVHWLPIKVCKERKEQMLQNVVLYLRQHIGSETSKRKDFDHWKLLSHLIS